MEKHNFGLIGIVLSLCILLGACGAAAPANPIHQGNIDLPSEQPNDDGGTENGAQANVVIENAFYLESADTINLSLLNDTDSHITALEIAVIGIDDFGDEIFSEVWKITSPADLESYDFELLSANSESNAIANHIMNLQAAPVDYLEIPNKSVSEIGIDVYRQVFTVLSPFYEAKTISVGLTRIVFEDGGAETVQNVEYVSFEK